MLDVPVLLIEQQSPTVTRDMLCLIANRAKYEGFRWWLSHSMRVISNDELNPVVRG